MERIVKLLVGFLCSSVFSLVVLADGSYLSNLKATRDSPLYTTYAAAKERSEFILDEGYHLRFYDPELGIDFTTDTAGDWCVAFRKGSQTVYALKDMFREPVITVSYPDLVTYHYFPFENIRVEVTFLVFSSRMAVQEVNMRNLGKVAETLHVIPFFFNRNCCLFPNPN